MGLLGRIPPQGKSSPYKNMNITQEQREALQNTPFTLEESEEETTEETEGEESPAESTEAVSGSTEEEPVADKARVPYSRFETVNEAKIVAETEARMLREELAKFKGSATVEADQNVDLPEEWVALYGDSDDAKKAYAYQVKLNERIQDEAANKAIERIQSKAKDEQELIDKNLEQIEGDLAKFQEKLGRDLTDSEESAILDIQDEFTPKDENGRYLAPLLSPEKAFEVYTLRRSTAKAAKIQTKRAVTSLTGAGSGGEVSTSSADYNALKWGSWRDKI